MIFLRELKLVKISKLVKMNNTLELLKELIRLSREARYSEESMVVDIRHNIGGTAKIAFAL